MWICVDGDYMHCVHICWWWLYMLCAYMLLVKSFTCDWWWIVGVRMYWNIIGVDLWNYMKYVLLLSSPSSHTVDLVTFISMLVIRYLCIHYSGCLFGVIWCVYMHQGRRPRRWKEIGTSHSWVGLVTLYVSRKCRVCLWAWCEYMLVLCVLDDCCNWNLVLVYSLLRMFEFMIIYARYY